MNLHCYENSISNSIEKTMEIHSAFIQSMPQTLCKDEWYHLLQLLVPPKLLQLLVPPPQILTPHPTQKS